MTLHRSGKPRIDSEDIGCSPDPVPLCELSSRVSKSGGVRPLTRGNDDGTALLDDLTQLSRKPNQNKVLSDLLKTLLLRFYLKRVPAATTLLLSPVRGALAYAVSNSSTRPNTSRSVEESGSEVTRK